MPPDSAAAQYAVVGPGPSNGLTDVAGIEVGHVTRTDHPYLTGTTAVLTRGGAMPAVDVRGGAPATRDTDALDPRNLVDAVHAVVLSGGSAYGLDTAGGAMRWLEEHGVGRPVGAAPWEVVPVVPAAALFDLGRGGSFSARPDLSFGYEAAAAASSAPVVEGVVGAGTGALVGNFVGRRLKGGIGTASVVTVSGVTVAVLVVVNALGQAVDPATGLPYALGLTFPGELPELVPPSAAELARHLGTAADVALPHSHTVLAVVATDAALVKSEAADLARATQGGLARAIRPAHTRFDGDTVFALATGQRELVGDDAPAAGAAEAASHQVEPAVGSPPSVADASGARDVALAHLGQLGADCLSRAIVRGLLAATSVGAFTAYRDAFPSAFRPS
jgi:putative pantetheine hydrolase